MISERKREYMRHWRAVNPERVREQARKWAIDNSERKRAAALQWQATNPEKVRAAKLKRIEAHRKYNREYARKRKGLPIPTRVMPELCEANCGRRAKCLDHCHITNTFRGWLCNSCNRGLGLLGDTVTNLNNLINYMRRATS